MFTCKYMFMYISIYAHICVYVYVYTIIHVCNCSLQKKPAKWSYWHCHIISYQLASSNFFSLRFSFQVPFNNRALSFPRCPPVGKVLLSKYLFIVFPHSLSKYFSQVFQSISSSRQQGVIVSQVPRRWRDKVNPVITVDPRDLRRPLKTCRDVETVLPTTKSTIFKCIRRGHIHFTPQYTLLQCKCSFCLGNKNCQSFY